MSDALNTTRNRDAHATLRGFVYQVNLTIERWLALDVGEELILEAGEDIDHLARAITESGEQRERTLEQVKNLTDNITLRSAVSIQCIAAFVEHRHNNPEARLRFRFTTSAEAGVEHGGGLQSPGIVVWERLRQGELLAEQGAAATDALLAILRSASRPPKLAEPTWRRFVELIHRSREDFVALLHTFEWSVGAPSAQELETSVRADVRALFDDEEAYSFLFLHVCTLLTKPDPKHLRRGDLETVALQRSRNLHTIVHTIIEPQLSLLRAELSGPVAQIGREVGDIAREVEAIRAQVDKRPSLQIETGGRLSLRESPPPLPARFAPRRRLAGTLAAQLEHVQWLAIHGDAGTGKSLLVSLVSQQSSQWYPAIWLRLRDASVQEAAVSVHRAIQALQEPAARSSAVGTIVLEDLPRTVSGDVLSSALADLTTLAPRVVSTGSHPLPGELAEIVTSGLHQLRAPLFDDDEARELLQAYGAPSEYTGVAAALLVARTGGHPTLVVAALRVLESSKWSIPALTSSLIDDGFAQAIASEVFERLLRTIEDAPCRQLLGRAAIAIGELSRQQLRELADVEPRLEFSDECIHRALGIWLREEEGGQVSVSPLLRVKATERLPPSVLRDTRLALGRSILALRVVTPAQIIRAFGYFAAAEDWRQVAWVLLQALASMRRGPRVEGTELLVELSTSVLHRLDRASIPMLSAERLVLARDQRKTADDRARVAAAVRDSGTPAWILTHIASVAGLDERQKNFDLTLSITESAVRVYTGAAPVNFPDEPPLPSPLATIDVSFLVVILMYRSGSMIEEVDDLRAWTKLLGVLPKPLVTRTLGYAGAQGLLPYIANRVWMHDRDGKSTEQWMAAADALASMADLAGSLGSDCLLAAATRARTLIVAERLDRRTEAIKAAVQTAERVTDPWSRFLILEAIASQTFHGGDRAAARKLYDEAIAYAGDSTDIEVVEALLRAAIVAEDDSALKYAEQAEALASAMPNAIPTVVARGAHETGIALVRAGRLREAFAKTAGAYAIAMTAMRSEDSTSLRTVLVVGNQALWFMYIKVLYNRDYVIEPGEREELRQGMFLNAPDELASRVDEAFLARAQGTLGVALALLGDRAGALAWGQMAWERLLASTDPQRHLLLPHIADTLSAAALLERRYPDALNFMYQALSSFPTELGPGERPRIDPALGTVQVILAASVCAVIWDLAEGTSSLTGLASTIRATIHELAQHSSVGPSSFLLDCDKLLDFMSSTSSWQEVHFSPLPDEMYAIKNLVASIAHDASPQVAVALQVLAMQNYPLVAVPTLRSWVVVPALLAHWKQRVGSQGFLFRAPTRVLAALEQITGNDERALRAILSEVVDATDAGLPGNSIAWLRN